MFVTRDMGIPVEQIACQKDKYTSIDVPSLASLLRDYTDKLPVCIYSNAVMSSMSLPVHLIHRY